MQPDDAEGAGDGDILSRSNAPGQRSGPLGLVAGDCPMSGAPMLTLAIPALNESAIILENAAELKGWMTQNLPEVPFEILVIDDGSTDGMGDLLEAAAAEDPRLRVVHHVQNMGRGRGVRTAMAESDSDYLIVLDADLSYGPEHIPALLEPLQRGRADVTLASPYHKDGAVENVPGVRALMSRWGNRVLVHSFQSDISTATCIVRGYTREVMDHLELVNDGKDLHLEVLYKAELLGFRIKEVPAKLIWRDRKRGRSDRGGMSEWLWNNPLLKMRRVIVSHFLFNFIARPTLLFFGPILAGFLIALYGTISLVVAYLGRLFAGDVQPLRQTLLDGQLTLTLTLASFLISVFVLFFLFIASQAKKYFEEQYILSTRSHFLLKQMQRRQDRESGS